MANDTRKQNNVDGKGGAAAMRGRRRHHSHSHSQEGGIHKPKQTGHDHEELQQDLLKAPQRSRRCCACSGPVPRRNVPRRDGIFCLVRSWVDVFLSRPRALVFFLIIFLYTLCFVCLPQRANSAGYSADLAAVTGLRIYIPTWSSGN